MKIIFVNLILCLGISLSFSSCVGQSNSQQSNTTILPLEIGKEVSKLDTTIWAIYQDTKSNYWFSSKENGVYFYNGKKLRHITQEDGLASNQIFSTQEDSYGNIFIESSAGVSKFDGQAFTTLEIKKDEASAHEWKLTSNDLWFRMGFIDNAVYRYNGDYLHFLKFPKSPHEDTFYRKNLNASLKPYGLYTIFKDRKGNMWFGTSSLGICHYDGKTLSWHYEDQLQTTPSGGDFGSRAIFEDLDGYYWFNNTRYRYDINSNSGIKLNYKKEDGIGYLNEQDEIEYPFFLSIEQDNDGDLWMVTYQDGVYRNNGKELIHYPIKDGETDVLLFTIYKDNQGVIWLGSFNAGVYKFNGKSFDKFEI